MSSLLQSYSNYCGIEPPLSPPDFPTSFIPLPDGPYITICTGAPSKSRIYDYYNKVIALIPFGDIKIVQIGAAEDYPIFGAIDYRGKANLRQEAFVIENGLLHIGNDHVFQHIAGAKGRRSVGLYSVIPASSAEPFYNYLAVSLEPDRTDKPSYTDDESPKTINSIKPEVAAREISKILGLNEKKIKTVYIGPSYNDERIDLIPDFPIPLDIFKGRKIVCRYDLCPNKEGLIHFLHAYGGAVITEDPIDHQILAGLKERIPHIVYFLDKNYNKDFIKALHYSGISYDLCTEKSGKELADLKLELFDYNQVKTRRWPDLAGFRPNQLFETKRVFFSRNQFYPSAWHVSEGITVDKCDYTLAGLDSKRFQDSWENLYIYE